VRRRSNFVLLQDLKSLGLRRTAKADPTDKPRRKIRSTASKFIARLLNVEAGEAPAVTAGLLMFFLLFTGYFMLRPARVTMGVAGGIQNLQWLFTGTFLVTLAVLPLFNWLASKVARRSILPWTCGFSALNLLGFAAALATRPDNLWAARAFYIWLSVFNLLAVSLAWSVSADIFLGRQAKRLFALLAGGASLGGLTGPILGTVLVAPIGHAGLLVLSALLLAGSAGAAMWLHGWRDRHPSPQTAQREREKGTEGDTYRPLGGNPFAGATAVFGSSYLAAMALLVVLLASISTFLYFEQARLVAETFPDRTRQTQVFGSFDTVVQALAIFTQFFFTGHIARKLGISVLLAAVPLALTAGFLWLALAPVFAVFVVVMVARRAGEYALVRPGREMLYTAVSAEQKYKAKNFIDTVVYRGGDALSAWMKRALDLLADQSTLAMVIGSGIALVSAAVGVALGRKHSRLETLAGNRKLEPL
jgi:AAA family ATP:ADP antiporter